MIGILCDRYVIGMLCDLCNTCPLLHVLSAALLSLLVGCRGKHGGMSRPRPRDRDRTRGMAKARARTRGKGRVRSKAKGRGGQTAATKVTGATHGVCGASAAMKSLATTPVSHSAILW